VGAPGNGNDLTSCIPTNGGYTFTATAKTAATELSDQNTCGSTGNLACVYTISTKLGGAGCDLGGSVTAGAANIATGDITITGGTKCTSVPTIILTLTNGQTAEEAVTNNKPLLNIQSNADTGIYVTAVPNTIDGTFAGHTGLTTSNVVARTANTDVAHGHLYQLWDAGKIQGCKCDLGFDGPDCSHRISPHGDDPLTTVKSSMMKQVVQIGHDDDSLFAIDPRLAEEFLMVYHDPYGGVWRTDGIAASTNDGIAASRVQDALRALPNEVLDGVSVKARTSAIVKLCTRFFDGVLHISGFSETRDGSFKNSKVATNYCEETYALALGVNKMDFTIEFADKPGQTGIQYLMEVDINKRGAGSFPVSGGLHKVSVGSSYSVAEMNYNSNLGNLSELAECSDRGLDDGDGQCECFDGFRGLACEEQEALV